MEIHLTDLPQDEIYILLNPEINLEITNKLKSKFKSTSSAIKHLNLTPSIYRWIKERRYPLSILSDLLSVTQIPINRIQQNVLELKSGRYPTKGGNLSNPIFVKFPIEISEPFVRIVAHMIGDGHVTRRSDKSFSIEYYNKNETLLQLFNKDIFTQFGVIGTRGINKDTPLIRLPSPIGHILLKCNNTFNSKTCRVPNFIKNSETKIKTEFLKALFDDEAYVCYAPPQRYIELTLANKALLEDIKEMLELLGINCAKTYYKLFKNKFDEYTFYIRNYDNLLIFYNLVGFYHPEKQNKLQKIINNPGRKSYRKGETTQLILNALGKQNLTSTELAKLLYRKKVTINLIISKLKSEDKIETVGFKNRGPIWRLK